MTTTPEALSGTPTWDHYHARQPWAPRDLFDDLVSIMAGDGIPYCLTCGDWHHSPELCSTHA